MRHKEQTNLISEMPEMTRPRERLEHFGEEALSHQELLAIILRTGGREKNVMHLSTYVFSHFENLYDLKQATLEEFQQIKGIGKVKAIEIKAAIELGIRIAKTNQIKMGQISSTADVGEMLMSEMKDLQQEHLYAIYLNTKNEIIKKKTIFIGGLNQSVAHPREIFKGAVKYSAARIIIAHNHPSGNPKPSKNDCRFTSRIAECGEIMGIELLDHIIVGNESFISMREAGHFN